MMKKETVNKQFNMITAIFALLLLPIAFVKAQAQQPTPGVAKTVNVPAVKEKKLPNGLTVAVVERKNVPLITIQLLIKSGANSEDSTKAGLADMTASLLTKGTKTRSATQIAEQIEFLGGSINTGAGWNNSVVTITVSSDKLDQAMAILADVVLNPAFKQEEVDLLKDQTLDGLASNLKQPAFLANYVASVYSFNEHPVGGTIETIKSVSRGDILNFHKVNFLPSEAVLIFTGEISPLKANTLAQKSFAVWKKPRRRMVVVDDIPKMPDMVVSEKVTLPKATNKIYSNPTPTPTPIPTPTPKQTPVAEKILVIDLSNAGQASVNYVKSIDTGRVSFDNDEKISSEKSYYPATVLNSVLGGGYSSRLNQEIRIKRGLSYGAGSGFVWRFYGTNFGTRTQTKNESAAEVAELIDDEIRKLTDSNVSAAELNPRKLVLNGDFGRDLETTQGLAGALADLYAFGLPTSELNSYMKSVQAVTDAQVRDFAKQNLLGGDIIIVGDYAKFEEDLAKRFPNMTIDVIKADELDLSKDNLRK